MIFVLITVVKERSKVFKALPSLASLHETPAIVGVAWQKRGKGAEIGLVWMKMQRQRR